MISDCAVLIHWWSDPALDGGTVKGSWTTPQGFRQVVLTPAPGGKAYALRCEYPIPAEIAGILGDLPQAQATAFDLILNHFSYMMR